MSELTLNDVHQKMGEIADAIHKEIADNQKADVEKYGKLSADNQEKMDRLNTEYERLEDRAKEMEKSIADLRSPANHGDTGPTDQETKDAFCQVLRSQWTGQHVPDETKALVYSCDSQGQSHKVLTSYTNTAAGYLLMPPAYQKEIIKVLADLSPIRAHARVIPVSGKSLQIPKRTTGAAASWVSETRTSLTADTTLAYGLEEIPNHELEILYTATLDMLEDSAFPLEQELRSEMAEAWSVAEGTAFFSGTGNNQPMGLETEIAAGTITATANGTSATVIQAEAIYKLIYALSSRYANAPGASVFMHRRSTGVFRTLKDGGNNYMWAPGLETGEPARLCGYPIVECTDAESPTSGIINTYSAATYPVIFGDMRSAYVITDRVGMSIQRLNELYAPLVGFWGRSRVGGQVVNGSAINALSMAT